MSFFRSRASRPPLTVRRLTAEPLTFQLRVLAILAAAIFSGAVHQAHAQDGINLNINPEIAAYNEEVGKPDLLFYSLPLVSVNGTPFKLIAMEHDGLLLLSANGRRQKVLTKSIREFKMADDRFTYNPRTETLVELLTRLRNFPGLADRYKLVINDDRVNMALFNEPLKRTVGAAPAAADRGVGSVPLPQYEVAEPWTQVNLLNPPPPPPRPAPVAPPALPPAVAPPEPAGGIPEWGKYAIAACGIAAIFVFLKR